MKKIFLYIILLTSITSCKYAFDPFLGDLEKVPACENGGTLVGIGAQNTCSCPFGYTGDRCQSKLATSFSGFFQAVYTADTLNFIDPPFNVTIQNYDVRITPDDTSATHFRLYGFKSQNINDCFLLCQLITDTTFTVAIPSIQGCSLTSTYTGSGTISTSKIQLNYVKNPSPVYNGKFVITR